jgi:hypothetical protein
MNWVFFNPFSFLEVVPSGIGQGYFHPQFSFFCNIKKKFKTSQTQNYKVCKL